MTKEAKICLTSNLRYSLTYFNNNKNNKLFSLWENRATAYP